MPKQPKTPPPPPPNACIQCMKRPAAPHNGGLCEVCAPPLNVPRTREFISARRALHARSQPAAESCACHLLTGATAGCPRDGYGLGA